MISLDTLLNCSIKIHGRLNNTESQTSKPRGSLDHQGRPTRADQSINSPCANRIFPFAQFSPPLFSFIRTRGFSRILGSRDVSYFFISTFMADVSRHRRFFFRDSRFVSTDYIRGRVFSQEAIESNRGSFR